jgi:hypothetical protein
MGHAEPEFDALSTHSGTHTSSVTTDDDLHTAF